MFDLAMVQVDKDNYSHFYCGLWMHGRYASKVWDMYRVIIC